MTEYEKILDKLMQDDDRFLVMTAENRAMLRNIAPKLGERFLDTGITEQTMIGMAAGLASRGRKPIVHALAAFLTMRAFEFIRTDIGIARLPVKLMGFVPGFLSDGNGPTHQAIEDIALMRGVPGMHVACPADEAELCALLPEVFGDDNPWYVRLCPRPSMKREREPAQIGRGEWLRRGQSLCLLTYGFMLEETLACADLLTDRGISVSVGNLRTLEPIDKAMLLRAAQEHPFVVTIEDHFLRGGLRSIFAEVMCDAGIATRTLHLGFSQKWFKPGRLREAIIHAKLDSSNIAAQILTFLEERNNER